MSVKDAIIANQLEEPKSSSGAATLPCGYLDASGVLHTEVEFSELTGYDEDLLASRSMPNHKKMGAMIGRCLRRVGSITDKGKLAVIANELLFGDRAFLLFELRKLTFGPIYMFNAKCPSCDKDTLFETNFNEDVKIKQMPDPTKRIYEAVLPSGKPIRFRLLNGADEERLAKVSDPGDKLSTSLLLRIELLDGKPPTLHDVKSLSMRDRDTFRDMFEDIDGGVITSVELQCPACFADFEQTIDPGQAGFFFPSATLRKSKKRHST